MNNRNPKSTLLSATIYIVILVFAISYKHFESSFSTSQLSIAIIGAAVLILGVQLIRYLRGKKDDT